MSTERIASMVAAAIGSTAGFYVITQSGLAGSLAGAAVAAMIYVGTYQWLTPGMQRGAGHLLGRAVRRDSVTAADADSAVEDGLQDDPANGVDRPRGFGSLALPWRRRLWIWAPVLLGIIALGLSGYAVVAGEPLERVVVREIVVEKPVVEEHVMVERETVTVTVPVYVGPEASGSAGPDRQSSGAATSARTTTTKQSASSPTSSSVTSTTTASSGTETTKTAPTTTPTTEPSSTESAAPPDEE